MNKIYFYFFISITIYLLGFSNTVCLASENLVTSLDTYKTPTDLENIKVIKLSSDNHSSNFLIFIKKSVPPHFHESHSESIYVISGSGKFSLAGKIFKISSGDFINVPEGTVHSVEVTSKEPLKVLSNQAPEFLGKDRIYVK